jgi:hypothetical protein
VAHKKEKISNFMCSEELDLLYGSAAGFSSALNSVTELTF